MPIISRYSLLVLSVIFSIVVLSMIYLQAVQGANCDADDFIEFRSTKLNPKAGSKDQLYYISDQGFSEREIFSLKTVLSFYQIQFLVENGKLFVDCKTSQDLDLMANITTKALDSEWLSSHK